MLESLIASIHPANVASIQMKKPTAYAIYDKMKAFQKHDSRVIAMTSSVALAKHSGQYHK